MLILPAIDLRRGNCVRLYQGRADQETIYSSDPLEVATTWKEKGATMLHIADLDGAFEGKPVNINLARLIRQEVGIPVQMGGGFRQFDSIKIAFDNGIDRVILGTAAVRNPDLVAQAVATFGNAISVSVDTRGDFATAGGWRELSAISYSELAKRIRDLGVSELIFTDTRKDGTLEGPNLGAIKIFLEAAQIPVLVSGGVASLTDISDLKELEPSGLKGVIIGKALYEKTIELEDAVRVAG